MKRKQTKPIKTQMPPVKVWPETYRKLTEIAERKQWTLVVALDNAVDAFREREQESRVVAPLPQG